MTQGSVDSRRMAPEEIQGQFRLFARVWPTVDLPVPGPPSSSIFIVLLYGKSFQKSTHVAGVLAPVVTGLGPYGSAVACAMRHEWAFGNFSL